MIFSVVMLLRMQETGNIRVQLQFPGISYQYA